MQNPTICSKAINCVVFVAESCHLFGCEFKNNGPPIGRTHQVETDIGRKTNVRIQVTSLCLAFFVCCLSHLKSSKMSKLNE